MKWNAKSEAMYITAINSEKGWYSLTYDSNKLSKETAHAAVLREFEVEAFRKNGQIEYRDSRPNDANYGEQWSLEKIHAPAVWDFATGENIIHSGEEIVIAIIDGAFKVDHPDIVDNLWVNPAEIPNNNIDDDNNGYVDDVFGANMISSNGNHNPFGNSEEHGTNVSGIAAAKGNNSIGIAGIAYNSKILWISGANNVDRIMMANEYIMQLKREYINSNGVRGANIMVTSFSGGVSNADSDDYPEWCSQYDELGDLGILNVSAAPNEFKDYNVDVDMPTRCPSEFLIVATNSNSNDQLAAAGFSSIHIDIASPGEKILTTSSFEAYTEMSGTSASTPLIAGSIALLYSIDCSLFENVKDKKEVSKLMKKALIQGVSKSSGLENRTSSGGRLDVRGSMNKLREICGLSAEPIGLTIHTIRSFEKSIEAIEFSTLSEKDVYVTLYNSIGQLIYSIKYENPDIWKQNVIYTNTFSGLEQGLYILHLDNGDFHTYKKLVF